MSDSYDYIIAGGGCAGMSLAYYFLQDEYFWDKRILLVEKDAKAKQDKTWCYWSQEIPRFKSAGKVSWNQFAVGNTSDTLNFTISPYSYFHINSLDFHREIQGLIETSSNISYLQASITNIEEGIDKVIVATNRGNYESAYVFSSLPGKIIQEPQKYHYLKQHFLGWEISCQQEIFDKETVQLMDFNHPGLENSFFYLLPFSSQNALVEFTVFSEELLSEEAYESQLKAYIEEKLGIRNYTIGYRENGIIPMYNQRLSPNRNGKRQILLGTTGGCSKSSKGYTFDRIQEQSKVIVSSLKRNGDPIYSLKSKSRFNIYDTLLLNIIKYQPELIPHIFLSLFKQNSPEKVLKFLDEKTSLWEEASIFLRLPWPPFFRAIQREFLQRLSYILSRPQISLRFPLFNSSFNNRLSEAHEHPSR
ncbi:MAG: lycopene cyclase family protein [Bacteroidota bacterium]